MAGVARLALAPVCRQVQAHAADVRVAAVRSATTSVAAQHCRLTVVVRTIGDGAAETRGKASRAGAIQAHSMAAVARARLGGQLRLLDHHLDHHLRVPAEVRDPRSVKKAHGATSAACAPTAEGVEGAPTCIRGRIRAFRGWRNGHRRRRRGAGGRERRHRRLCSCVGGHRRGWQWRRRRRKRGTRRRWPCRALRLHRGRRQGHRCGRLRRRRGLLLRRRLPGRLFYRIRSRILRPKSGNGSLLRRRRRYMHRSGRLASRLHRLRRLRARRRRAGRRAARHQNGFRRTRR
mmetsp:Transcript_7860/g.22492  ORF Transcript_7860/g.22492 Transcript_7860/m.22492 type:complete len:290 (+) Transcript_7860:273-1142(+)